MTEASGWSVSPLCWHVAEEEIAHAHGHPQWSALESALSAYPRLLEQVRGYRKLLSAAKRAKQTLFPTGLP